MEKIEYYKNKENKMIYSCLSYPGAKRKVIDQLIEVMPDGIEDWREPFLGGGSVSIGFLQSAKAKDCKKFIVGDLYTELWMFWVQLQKNPKAVADAVQNMFYANCKLHDDLVDTPKDAKEFEQKFAIAKEEALKFWKWTQEDNTIKQLNDVDRAARFFIVNHISFSSMSDSGSLSMDRYQGFNMGYLKRLYEVSEVIQKLEILNAPFQTTMADVGENSFVFLDPPYIAQEKSGLYGKNGSTHHGFPHQELADLCKSLKCKWLMTIDDSIAARKLYAGCEINTFHIPYTMAMNNADDALAGEELLVSNYDIYPEESYDELSNLL